MSRRVVRWILALAPRSFQDRYGDELLSTLEARSSGPRGLRSGLREVAGAAWLVIRLHLRREHRLSEAGGARGAWIAAAWQDGRYAVRMLRRNAGFSTAVIAVLALGIGATSAIFSAANAYLFRPLPFADPERLVTVFETNPEFGWVDQTAAPANLLDWREQVEAFADVSGYTEFTDELAALREGQPVIVTGTEVLGNFFSTLGVPAALGRTFRMEETWLGEDDVVVLSHDLWVDHFGADPDVIGRRFEFANHAPEIVGVMPPGFTFPDRDIQLWYPMGFDPAAATDLSFRRAHWVRAFARLESDVSHAEADAQLQVVVRRLQEEYPATNAVMGAGIMPMRDFLTQDARTSLGILLGAGAFLLLLACTNVANLLLVRASERAREVTLRCVLGASRPRMVRQMLIESAVLAAVGGVVGLALGWLAVRAVSATAPMGIDGATSVSLDWRVALFTLGAAALSGLVCGTAPALRAGRDGTDGLLSDGARGSTAGRAGLRAAAALVSVQVALAVLLVVGAGLMARTFWLLQRVDPGFRTDGVLAVQFALQAPRYGSRDDVLGFYDRFAEALEARPGVERVGTVARLPLDGRSWSSQFIAEGWPPDRVGIEILHRRADPAYFEALDIPLLSGRMFEPGDRLGPQPLGASPGRGVVLVNETFAREYFPGEDPIGRRITYDRAPGPRSIWYEIIGIVGDQQQESLARPALPEVFENRDQDWGRNNWIVVRGAGDAADLIEPVRSVLGELDPLIPIARIRPLETVRTESMVGERSILLLLSAFGLAALLLATVGIYGVTSRAARRRTQEIGIRMALGARGKDVERLMLARGLAAVAVGLAAGLAASLIATRALSSLLYGVEPTDPVTLGAVVALLGSVAWLACWVPVRRATTADPLAALRSE